MIKVPTIRGIIDRRILINFRVKPEILTHQLPEPFRPKIISGYGVAGICLIRLKQIRPKLFVPPVGLSSENAAHRIAVEWDKDEITKEGVFIPRRDTSSQVSALVGGRIFPGEHHHAQYIVEEQDGKYRVEMKSVDELASLIVEGRIGKNLPDSSIFESLEHASRFFEGGALGYSSKKEKPGEYDGLELRTFNWSVKPLIVEKVESSYFSDKKRYPDGSIEFDNALLMTGIEHEWHGWDNLYVE